MSVAARAFMRMSPLRAQQTAGAMSARAMSTQRPLTPAEFEEQKNAFLKKVAAQTGVADPETADLVKAIYNDPSLEKEYNRLAELHPIQYSAGHRLSQDFNVAAASTKDPVRVAITGAAGSIGYATLFRIANGEMLGKDQPVILQCLEMGAGLKAMKGVAMELEDCAFPLLRGVEVGDDAKKVFKDTDYALLIGAKPRGPGMERGDLLRENAEIFKVQGQALNESASKDCKVLVVGNPANTNALITSAWAKDIPKENITAMTRLDETRAVGAVCAKTGAFPHQVERVAIWGNHSATQYPDLSHALINGKKATEVINDDKWVKETFIPKVQKRGAEVIAARGASSAASAGNAAIEHMRELVIGSEGRWVSMAVPSDGTYGVDEGLWYSKPVVTEDGKWNAIANVPIDPFSAEKMEATRKELVSERDAVKDMLPKL